MQDQKINQYTHTNSKGKEYFLHSKMVTLRNGAWRIYYFAKKLNKEFSSALPEEYRVFEGKNGLPMVKKV